MKFHRLLLWTVLLLSSVWLHLRAQAQTDPSAVDEYDIPNEVETCVKASSGLVVHGEINPFYLSGNFDGDGKLDFAVQVRRGDSKGVLICLSSRKTPLLVGAGSSLVWPATQKWRFDAWSVIPKESTAVSRPARAKHDAILLDIKEAANGLLYWDGTSLKWEQLSD